MMDAGNGYFMAEADRLPELELESVGIRNSLHDDPVDALGYAALEVETERVSVYDSGTAEIFLLRQT